MTPQHAFERLLQSLDHLGIQYMVSGSGASSAYGIWRATGDIDIVARLAEEHVEPLAKELEQDFYIDRDQVRTALTRQRSFNVIHFASSYKFDIFPLGHDRYDQEQFGRRRVETASPFGSKAIRFAIASPEDVILSKLRWYRLGNETSGTQWNDVLGVIAVQAEQLDLAYMREWAEYLRVADLLDKALAERHDSA